jgi:hypothetical protein
MAMYWISWSRATEIRKWLRNHFASCYPSRHQDAGPPDWISKMSLCEVLGLKIRCPKGRAGSTPALGTIPFHTVFTTSINLAPGMISARK